MVVDNRITKILIGGADKYSTPFDKRKIVDKIIKASEPLGGLKNNLFGNLMQNSYGDMDDEEIADELSDKIISSANDNPRWMNKDTPPTKEDIQFLTINVLSRTGFGEIAANYSAYMQGKHLTNLSPEKGGIYIKDFVGHGFPKKLMQLETQWNESYSMQSLSSINEIIKTNPKKMKEIIGLSNERQKKQMAGVLEAYKSCNPPPKIVFFCGPSSSGKTTTTRRFVRDLEKDKDLSKKIITLELDMYYQDEDSYPRDYYGDLDYEKFGSLDVWLVQQHLKSLFEEDKIYLPIYKFKLGKRIGFEKEPLQLDENTIVVIDFLYGAVPDLYGMIPKVPRFGVYLENFGSQILAPLEGSSRPIFLTDSRLLRRGIRDMRKRGKGDLNKTLGHWHYVRKGETEHTIPRMNTCDYIVNTGFPWEWAAMKTIMQTEKRYKDIVINPDNFISGNCGNNIDAYVRATRLKQILDNTEPLPWNKKDRIPLGSLVPEDCVLREFIGGSPYEKK